MRSVLRAEAAAHQPDREAMLARITSRAMSGPVPVQRRPGSRLRLAVVGALVALFGGGGFAAQWALAGATDNDQATPVVSATAPASPSAPAPRVSASSGAPASSGPVGTPSATTKPTASGTTAPATGSTTTPPAPAPALTKGQPGFTRVEQGPLWSDGSIDPDSGDTQGAGVITLKSTEKLTALTVTVRVAKTPGLTSRGGTKSVPGASVTSAVTDRPDALLYTFTLASADEIAPGTYTFTAKYSYPAGGRNAGGDTYEAVATTAAGQSLDVYGNFFPAG
ncbi:hypothetical protein BJY16_000132 [Actinoplanes octamycinicus]|uniref:Uncharacterized protein n=1 Tax=Actinoplanes octamycinicus TaxID=135948 RepID=A0A7W7GQZ4_9ACTN|nr:hypothetical protein [Actinoplanes octamycinicus]MBB4736673.1 hypothetical protein [Actinoplanes octamycinicus]